MSTQIRFAKPEDTPSLLSIYNPFIEHTNVSFEYKKLTLDEFQARITGIQSKFPFLVVDVDGVLAGYAYTSSFHPRAAYAWDCDISIYIDSPFQKRGLGELLYHALFSLMKEMDYYNIYALVSSENTGSLHFHETMGFLVEGHHEMAGYKFGKWIGVTRLVKRIGDFSIPPKPVKSINEIDGDKLLLTYMESTSN
ncbi:MAG: hypothetical protein PWP24_682 [Clostridiales bacterium]|nr:hypothetical protein [Clostridiales bacterium]